MIGRLLSGVSGTIGQSVSHMLSWSRFSACGSTSTSASLSLITVPRHGRDDPQPADLRGFRASVKKANIIADVGHPPRRAISFRGFLDHKHQPPDGHQTDQCTDGLGAFVAAAARA